MKEELPLESERSADLQGTFEQLHVLFQTSTIPAAPTCLAFGTLRECSASAEGQDQGSACF